MNPGDQFGGSHFLNAVERCITLIGFLENKHSVEFCLNPRGFAETFPREFWDTFRREDFGTRKHTIVDRFFPTSVIYLHRRILRYCKNCFSDDTGDAFQKHLLIIICRSLMQPITPEEVEKASRISPLAMSLVKPPDPEILQGMSLKDQREYMAQHAERTLSQTSLTSYRKTSLEEGESRDGSVSA